MYVALAATLVACGGGGTPASHAAKPAGHPAASTAGPAASPSATAAGFVPIVEPFDPGHPARARAAPARCAGQATALAVESCYEARTEDADAAIDALQLGRYEEGSPSQRAAILADDRAWLSARQPVCARAFRTGGTTDRIDVAACLLDESTARLDALREVTPPESTLRTTDSINPSSYSWYTTPEGSRIAVVDTQGDNSGGAIIAWVIIGGAEGFIVNPRLFYFQDGSFTDHGVVEPPDPAGHRVPPGAEYQFDIDYTRLSADPDAARGTGGYVYVPGTPVAIWR